MAALPPEALVAALGAVHKTGLNTDPNATASPGGGTSAPAAPADPAAQQDPAASQDPNADPNAQQADAAHQALWQLFPTTDPNWLQTLISQGGDPEQTIGQAFQQVESERGQFNQMQDALLAHLVAMFASPQGGGMDESAAPPESPGVGGMGSGY